MAETVAIVGGVSPLAALCGTLFVGFCIGVVILTLALCKTAAHPAPRPEE